MEGKIKENTVTVYFLHIWVFVLVMVNICWRFFTFLSILVLLLWFSTAINCFLIIFLVYLFINFEQAGFLFFLLDRMFLIQWRYYTDFWKRYFLVLGYSELEDWENWLRAWGGCLVSLVDKLPVFSGNQDFS